ncbi:MAG: tetratricopeptide repeat protein, partial [Acidobacteriota bacterium]|nr:tetratricopeptide repeat protein [Acidobacteriota bacterium]
RLNRDFPTSLGPKMELANLALAQKRYTEAEAMYRALYSADPKNIRALQGVVDVYFAQNRPDAAIQFLSGEAAKGDSPQVRIVLADAALRAQKTDLAIQEYTQLVKANPKSSFGHMRLGDAYLTKGNNAEAINQFEAAKAISPKDPLISSMLALSLHDAGRSQEAQKAYRDALGLQSGNPLVMNNLAYLMAETGGNLDEALRLAQDASRRQPANFGLSDTVGWIYLKKNLTDSAIQILSNVVQKDPQQPVYHYHLGAALFQKGDKAGAKRELQAALVNKPLDKDRQKIAALMSQLP